jgi:uncharacterized phage infection (PIP) family protein YhgE
MAAEKSDPAIEELQKKVDKLTEELAGLRKELKALNIDALNSELKEIQTQISPVSKIEDIISSANTNVEKVVGKKVDDLAKSIKGLDTTKKIDEIAKSVLSINTDVKEVKDSKESEVIIKKVDDLLVSMADVDVLVKKLDDLQGYVAGLSGIEEKIQDLASQFGETNEIVGIIVRQLDDIERKYNLGNDKVTEAVELLSAFIEEGGAPAAIAGKKPKETKDKKPPKVKDPTKASLPSTIDSLMSGLLDLVVPQTEATDMAEALEDVRDQLTMQIEGHTPVLFQFGKRAREFKSYPPTATLNENDIASLSREIKSWTSKLKETAKSGK